MAIGAEFGPYSTNPRERRAYVETCRRLANLEPTAANVAAVLRAESALWEGSKVHRMGVGRVARIATEHEVVFNRSWTATIQDDEGKPMRGDYRLGGIVVPKKVAENVTGTWVTLPPFSQEYWRQKGQLDVIFSASGDALGEAGLKRLVGSKVSLHDAVMSSSFAGEGWHKNVAPDELIDDGLYLTPAEVLAELVHTEILNKG